MRLVTAIRFSEEIKGSLTKSIAKLKELQIQGAFPSENGLFLTLNALGETDRTAEAKVIMDRITVPQFTLTVGGFGSFKRPGGALLWEGVDRCTELLDLQRQLAVGFRTTGYKTDTAEYKPYITLAKEAKLPASFDQAGFLRTIPFLSMNVEKVSLLRCDRIDGVNNYSEIYARSLPLE